ncbi:general transcription factor II-I repeat domain-containing protein 2-like [Centruroides sculpturatus]|uniref:general transcription factor II-I repeat domain-containing protein 2-like n=1 Tax=Centruroides sculpturatus TaxID=218467 RepID=UPI000C6DCE1F|nr:general transcription factor II-I repeat domain-containing protein 2-like [Centruroides sculpturatus]
MAPGIKRKVNRENHQFQEVEVWTNKYCFVQQNNSIICLLCNGTIAVPKEFNLKRHHESQHKDFLLQGTERKRKIESLRRSLISQQNVFKKQSGELDAAVEASLEISALIAKNGKPFTDGDMIKKCLIIAIANCAYFSLAVEESTDISSTAQVIVFIRSVSLDFIVNEEFLGMASLSGHTTGADLFTSLLSVCNKSALDFDKLSSIATDGAPSMVGCENGMVTLLKNHLGDRQKELVQYHCIIHQQQLCAKKLGFERLLKDVYDTVNLIRRHGLNHRLFTSFLEEIDADYADLPTYTEVRWLSKATVLKRFVELLGPIITFLKERGNTTRNLEGQRWQCDLAFLADITAYLNDLNLRLQGKMQLVSQLTSNINAFMTKLSLFKSHMQSENFTHFPHCKAMKEKYPHMKMDYSDQVNTLLTSFNERLTNENLENLLVVSTSVITPDIKKIAASIQSQPSH